MSMRCMLLIPASFVLALPVVVPAAPPEPNKGADETRTSTGPTQERECGTTLSQHDREAMLHQADTGAYELGVMPRATVYVPLTFHVVRMSNGTGGLPDDRICQALDDLDTAYLPAGIQFYLGGPVDYIDDDDFYFNINTLAEINALRSTNPVPDTINVYFTPNLAYEGGGLCGISAFTTSSVQAIAMANGCTALPTNHSTLPHEVGHYFDLLHTHETGYGAECVEGSNCGVAGDLICDTPADPNLSGNVNTSCQYTGTATDSCNNDPYSPDPTNLMSYSRKECRDNFTGGQDTRSLATLINLRPELVHGGLPGSVDCNSNGTRDDCDIGVGTSLDADTNGIPDECESGPCAAVGARSCRDHGGTALCLDLFARDTEPRLGGTQELEIDLDDAGGFGGGVSVNCVSSGDQSGLVAGTSSAGNTVIISFSPSLPDGDTCTVTIECGASVCVRGVEGDVNGDGTATTGDASIIKPHFNAPAAAAGAQFDFNVDGTVSTADFSQVKPTFNNTAPACP